MVSFEAQNLGSFLAGILAGACHRQEGIESHSLHRGGIHTPNGVLCTGFNSKSGYGAISHILLPQP